MMAQMTTPTFVEWLQKRMMEQRMSQAELARRSGISQGHISLIIAGDRQPTYETMRTIALGMRLDPKVMFAELGVIEDDNNKDAGVEMLASRLMAMSPAQRELVLSAFLDLVDALFTPPPSVT